MYLNASIPLLFAIPSSNSSKIAVASSLFILLLAVISYLAAEISSTFPYFILMTTLIACHGFVCLITTGANLLYIMRYFLVWMLIFGTAFVWFKYPGEVYVAPFGLEYQTLKNTRILVLAGLISLCGSLIGWQVSFLFSKYRGGSEFILQDKYRKRMRRSGLFLAISFSLLYVWKAGGFLGGDRAYGSVEAGFSLQFGVFNLFHFTGIALILLACIRETKIQTRFLFLAILSLIPGMLAGSRADFLPQTFLVFLLAFNPQILDMIKNRRYMQGFKNFSFLLVIFSLAYLVSTFIAIARTGLNPFLAIDVMLSNGAGLLINSVYGHKMLYFETGNMMLGGLYSAIVQVREGFTGLLFGQSYFDYFLISPPAFLGLPRPLGLEWATDINGTIMTQGGIFEVAEAYWNFGLIGCFLVSFFLSYLFGWLLQRGLKSNNYFFIIWYIVFGLHGFRSIWYQNFSYFRLMTVMLVIYFLGTLFFSWFLVNRRVVNTELTAINRKV